MARHPYRIARQEHLGDALDDLQRRGRLNWRWEYDQARHRAIFHVELPGQTERALDTRAGESVAEDMYAELDVRWLAVPHPGGERQLEETRRKMQAT